MKLLALFGVVVVSALGGGVVARMFQAPPVAAPPAPVVREVAPVERDLAPVIRSLVRDELSRARPETPAPPPVARVVEPSAEQLVAHDRVVAIVDKARTSGRWTDDDRQRWQELAPSASEADRLELLHTLIPAINRGELKVTTQGLPF